MQRFRKLSVNFALALALVGLGGAASFGPQNIPSAVMRSPSVKGEAVYEPYRKIVLKAGDGVSAKAQFLWDVEGTGTVEVVEAGEVLYVWAEPGSYKVTLTSVDFEAKKIERARFTFKVSGKRPDPNPPTPPEPNPPTPPNPDNPAPIPVDGFRVLIVEETADRAKLPPKQLNILSAKEVRDYLRAKTANNGTEWAIWDKDVDTSAEPKLWQDAMKIKRDSLPWLIVSNGKTGYSGPLPGTVEETMAVLRKYAEGK